MNYREEYYQKTGIIVDDTGVLDHDYTLWLESLLKDKDEHASQSNLIGWECPRCHKIHSPDVTECYCPPVIRVTTSTQ